MLNVIFVNTETEANKRGVLDVGKFYRASLVFASKAEAYPSVDFKEPQLHSLNLIYKYYTSLINFSFGKHSSLLSNSVSDEKVLSGWSSICE